MGKKPNGRPNAVVKQLGHTMHYADPRDRRTYVIWRCMRSRVGNPSNDKYKYYGGRGIRHDPSWARYPTFYSEMGQCPAGYSLEREDPNGDYCKSNCKWIPLALQNRNKRTTRWVEYEGVALTIPEACAKVGLNKHTLRTRLWDGKTMEQASGGLFKDLVSRPPHPKPHRPYKPKLKSP
jgi:hypothetical protein